MAVTRRRLPGFRFEAQPPPARDVLPRMDVAAFVGFAASGPLNIPVAIEDPATFAAIFGADLPLAWNRQRGEQVYAYLGPAVRAFFRCGGQRCYVIRVASSVAKANHFSLPGIAQAYMNIDQQGNVVGVSDISPAVARARSEGSWSDGLRASTALLSRSVNVARFGEASLVVRGGGIAEGDLLRLTYGDAGFTRLIVIDKVKGIEIVETVEIGSPPLPLRRTIPALRATVKYSLWLAELEAGSPPAAMSEARLFGSVEGGESLQILATETEMRDGTVVLSLQVPLDLADAPPAGSMLTVDLDTEWLLLSVREVRGGDDIPTSPVQETIWMTCTGVKCRKSMQTPDNLHEELPLAERLTFELRARPPEGDPFSLVDLAFSLEHPRSWNGLPEDEQEKLPMGERNGLPTDVNWFTSLVEQEPVPDVWKQAAEPRFPLAGGRVSGDFTFPFAMSVLPEYELPPYPAEVDALIRDGLADFSTTLFLDEALAGTTTFDLAGRADYIRYLNEDARHLNGIHAAMAIEEATLIAVPDALHPGWTHVENPTELYADPITPLDPPDWSHFLDCGYRIWPSPTLRASEPNAAGTFTLSWDWEPNEPTESPVFTLEESTLADFDGALPVYSGADPTHTIYGRARGDYYYRVHATAGGNISDWSNGVGVRVAPGSQWMLNEPNAATEHRSLTIHRALIRMCAARGDIVAVLAMPEHFREDDAIHYAQALTPFSTLLNPDDLFDFPLSFAEDRALSYAVLYHPWLYIRDGDFIHSTPPDGAMCGMIARRAIDRGAWIAPANQPITGALALNPPLGEERWLDLLEAQINIIKSSPNGFIAQSADTLSLDDDLRPLNVRRLLILLRRLVLQRGALFVFEPFDDVFRRMVQRGIESVLEGMYERGAFAGHTSSSAFQVVPRSTPQDIDQGRFIIDLRVAPSLPMEFLTVRLVQSGDSSIVSEER